MISLVCVHDLHNNNRYTGTRGTSQLKKGFEYQLKKNLPTVILFPLLVVSMNKKKKIEAEYFGNSLSLK